MSFTTPVLLIIFNRKDNTQKVFDQIKKVKPKHFFIAADGPRTNRPDDAQKCAETRQIIEQIDWECELKTLFRDENRGCGYGPAEAITWFFEHVEEGIILEDDCWAETSFFMFCEVLLQKFRYEEKVAMICGTNPLIKWNRNSNSYIFSKIGFNWGWATWKRAWKNFDYDSASWKEISAKNRVRDFLQNKNYYNHFSREFDDTFKVVRNDVWDFQWLYCRFHHGYYSIVPNVNLVKNIGFNDDATHTFYENDLLSNISTRNIRIPLKDSSIKIDRLFDWVIFERYFNSQKRNLIKKIILKAIKIYHT